MSHEHAFERDSGVGLGGVGVGFPLSKVPQHVLDSLPRWMIGKIKDAEKPKTVAGWAFAAAMWMRGYGRLKEFGLPTITSKSDTKQAGWYLPASHDPFWEQTPQRRHDRDAALKDPLFWRKQHTSGPLETIGNAAESVVSGAAHEAQKAVTSAAKVVASTGGDAAKFVADQAKAFASDPVGQVTKVATSGGLSLIGVHPEDLLKSAGIPTPDQMLSKLGLPTPSQIAHVAYDAVTDPQELLAKVPGIGALVRYIPAMPDPTKAARDLVNAAVHGDLKAIEGTAFNMGRQVADVAAMVPGVGNVVGGPLASAITLLETGSALKAALQLLLAQVPGIPPQIREILRAILNGIADIVEQEKSVTDVLIAEIRHGVVNQVKQQGVPAPVASAVNDLIDGVIQVILHHKPLDRAALDLAKKGVSTAAKSLGANNAEVQKTQRAYEDLKGIYDKVDTIHALTQGVVQLTKNAQRDPTATKKIQDLKASIGAQELVAQAHAKGLDANLGRRPPPHLTAVAPAAPAGHAPPKLTAVKPPPAPMRAPPKLTAIVRPVAPATPARTPPRLTAVAPAAHVAPTGRRYAPYPW